MLCGDISNRPSPFIVFKVSNNLVNKKVKLGVFNKYLLNDKLVEIIEMTQRYTDYTCGVVVTTEEWSHYKNKLKKSLQNLIGDDNIFKVDKYDYEGFIKHNLLTGKFTYYVSDDESLLGEVAGHGAITSKYYFNHVLTKRR